MIQNQVIDNPQLIKLPFPPKINSRDLVVFHPDGRVPKTPNAFMIYRKLFVETARASGYNLPMNIISLMVSRSWEQEPEEIKNEYKRIAKEAFNYRNELFPKIKPQKKRDQWKTVSFDKPSVRKTKIPKPMKSVNKSTKHKQLQVTPNNDLLASNFDHLSDLSDLSDIDMNSPIFDLDLFTGWADFFSNQNTYSSPDLSITSSSNNSPSSDNFDFSVQQVNDDNNCILDDLVTNFDDQLSFLPNLSNTTTIYQDNLNDALIAYEMGFNYPI
ncbi:1247_t:CDS:2 [Racocetra fulgida]|uniref:1247_t:CDS:1 n=1 Tax=Racocetra fulgida TaxID=60492 RepID=A0A9N8VUK3_9GLOM|nr:1247_t:CDS:2 [Racocetra fulgida]